MPRTYAHNRGSRSGTNRRVNSVPFQAVATSQRQAANPYRMHQGDPLVNGVSNLAAALVRAPIERSQIEDQRAARAQMLQHQTDRENKDDLFREKQLQTQHEDAQARIASKAAGAKPAGQVPKMGTIPAFVHQSTVDPVTGKVTNTQRPVSDDEMAAALKNQQRVQTVGSLSTGINPSNGKPLGKANPYQIPLPSPQQQMAEQDALFAGPKGAPSPAAAQAQGVPAQAPAVAAPVQAAAKPALGLPGAPPAAAPVGGMPARDPHAIIDTSQIPTTLLDAAYPGGQQQAQAASRVIASAPPQVQQKYGLLLAAVTQAHQDGDARAVADASARLQIAHQRLGIPTQTAAPVGGMPQPAAPAAAPRPALAMSAPQSVATAVTAPGFQVAPGGSGGLLMGGGP